MIENENLFNILNKLDDAVIITDRDKKIIFQNDYSIKIFENDFTSQIITNLIRDPKILESLEQTICLLYTSPSPRDKRQSRMPSSA